MTSLLFNSHLKIERRSSALPWWYWALSTGRWQRHWSVVCCKAPHLCCPVFGPFPLAHSVGFYLNWHYCISSQHLSVTCSILYQFMRRWKYIVGGKSRQWLSVLTGLTVHVRNFRNRFCSFLFVYLEFSEATPWIFTSNSCSIAPTVSLCLELHFSLTCQFIHSNHSTTSASAHLNQAVLVTVPLINKSKHLNSCASSNF